MKTAMLGTEELEREAEGMEVEAYLKRIGITEGLEEAKKTTWDTLTLIITKHLESVPFENLDVRRKKPVTLSLSKAYQKVVRSDPPISQ